MEQTQFEIREVSGDGVPERTYAAIPEETGPGVDRDPDGPSLAEIIEGDFSARTLPDEPEPAAVNAPMPDPGLTEEVTGIVDGTVQEEITDSAIDSLLAVSPWERIGLDETSAAERRPSSKARLPDRCNLARIQGLGQPGPSTRLADELLGGQRRNHGGPFPEVLVALISRTQYSTSL